MLMPSANTAVATALGADLALGRMAGGGIMQRGFNWAIRGAGGPASIFILGMLPAKMGDGTLYTDDQLRSMSRAPTRVRFQFRRDAEGTLQVYGIHTRASGDDTVRTVQATWNTDKTALEAKLNGITILWTPMRGPLGEMPPLVYPDNNGEQLGTILVHPIPDGTDSQIEGLPGEDITTDDCILVFPDRSGLNSLYVVFARPIGGDHSYPIPCKRTTGYVSRQGWHMPCTSHRYLHSFQRRSEASDNGVATVFAFANDCPTPFLWMAYHDEHSYEQSSGLGRGQRCAGKKRH
jgi:hypothetical protein